MNFIKRNPRKEYKKYSPTKEHRMKLALAQLGKKLSLSTKKKISAQLSEEKAYQWKGDAVSISGMHKRMVKKYGKPSYCEFCGAVTARRFDWANVSGEYKYDIGDWKRLCKSCHNGWDASRRLGYEDRFFSQLAQDNN